MAYRAGNSPSARLKANLTRSLHKGSVPRPRTPQGDNKMTSSAKAPRLKKYKGTKRFLGSFKYGGPVLKTGLYLVHKGEKVVSPYRKG